MEDSNRSNVPYIIIAIVFFLIIHILFYAIKLNVSVSSGELVDTDNYMRLVRVEQLAETGDWYDSTIHRNNYPFGDTLHWTRPLDVLLLLGAGPLMPWLGLKKALLYWGIVISPILGILSMLALVWATKPILVQQAQRLLLIILIAQPLLFQVFIFGRPDHHSLLALLFILLLGCLTRMLASIDLKKHSILAGLIAAAATWVSVEAIFSIIMVFVALIILWIMNKDNYALMLRFFSLSLLGFTTLFLLVERPLSLVFTAAEYDKLSVVYVFVYLIAAAFSMGLAMIKNAHWRTRTLSAVTLALPSVLAIYLAFPAFFHGPMSGVNPAIVPIWLSKVSEIQPLLLSGYFTSISFLGSAGLALSYLIIYYITKTCTGIKAPMLLLSTGFIFFTALTLYQIRMGFYSSIIISILLAFMLKDIIEYLSKRPNKMTSFMRAGITILVILGFPSAGLMASSLQEDPPYKYQDVKTLSRYLNEYQDEHPDTANILASIDFGPEILYRTDYNIISAPYHRNDRGIIYTYEVMTSDNMEKVKGMLAEREIDLIAIAPDSKEIVMYRTENNPLAFYERLKSDAVPEWLTKLKLPENVKKSFIIYKVGL
ncbi:hypothetical protein ASZ90_019755 [hydrocarbon metagenome]|uniref:Uncharacterized protein n=1 Tax=hydrocarbon metagenome TaxID=938273 RepID=A0A0W8E2N1_9ZZZZ